MRTNNALSEAFLQRLLEVQSPSKEVQTFSGEAIHLLELGEINRDQAGPDFRNARIKIQNLIYKGDVEVDIAQSDWKTHGHNINRRFNSVILHIVLKRDTRQPFVYTSNGRKVPTVELASCFDGTLSDEIKQLISNDFTPNTLKIPCHSLAPKVDEHIRLQVLQRLGIERFHKKSDKLMVRLKEIAYQKQLTVQEPVVSYAIPQEELEKDLIPSDLHNKSLWNQLLYELIFEALGYSQNKTIMLHLAQAVDLEFISKIANDENFTANIESALFHIGSLLSEVESVNTEGGSEYLRDLRDRWLEIKPQYDGKHFATEDWHFFKLRPQNFPTIRLAGGVKLIDKILHENLVDVLVQKFKEIHNIRVLKNSVRSLFIVKSDGYWAKHYVFDSTKEAEIHYFVGSNRADEIVANVVFPFMYLYFKVFGLTKYAEKVLHVYCDVTITVNNSIVSEMKEALDMGEHWTRSVIYQGMIELFRGYCSKNRCEECEIGKDAFAFESIN